jgi:uncharacterized protein YbjT (DUF2867 family)
MMLVSGATGNVGGALVQLLAEAGVPVRALVRRPDSFQAPPGVTPVSGDLNRPQSVAPALAGTRDVFLLAGFADMPGLLAEVRRAGVERVVLLSGGAAVARETTNAISRYMRSSEAAVRESGVSWTILRPAAFMSNTLQWIPQLRAGDVVRAPFAAVPAAVIDPADIAAVAAEALRSGAHAGRVYRLTGPASLLPADRVRVLGEVLGRNLRFVGQDDVEARAQMSAAMPAEYVDAFFSFSVDGTLDESTVLPTVEQVTGRPPRTFRQWAEAHADAFH